MSRKIIAIAAAALLLFAGIIAVTQESEVFLEVPENENTQIVEEINELEKFDIISIYEYGVSNETPDWVKPLRWFRSNQGGMAIEELPSSTVALRSEYALAIGFSQKNKLPENLIPFFNDDYFIEVRTLFEKGALLRTQWIFRQRNGITRLNAVYMEQNAGFIEIFDGNSFLVTEYNFSDNGEKSKTDYIYKDGMLINTAVFLWEEIIVENDDAEAEVYGEYREDYADFFRYNRSSFLRAVERVFYRDRQLSLSNEVLRVSFPLNLRESAMSNDLASEKLNAYPEFFGEVHVERNNKIVYVTDERSRILSQTLYDENENIVWVIRNTWQNDRIISTIKTENGTEYLAEYEYTPGGDRIVERNFKNGILERLVRTEGKTEIEELYFNNIIVLRAVWQDGVKISETRTGGR